MANYPTPHIKATPGDFGKTVLMPGDPLRAKFIAETFLTDAKLVNNVRGVQGYTGFYKGKKVSVMASGMGMPSMGIYSYELYSFFGVESIIRVGSAGGMTEGVKIRDVVLAMGASTNSNFQDQYLVPGHFSAIADFGMLTKAYENAVKLGANCVVGNVLSSDTFYTDDVTASDKWRKLGILCVEMESAALYMTAARLGKKALSMLTISDHLLTGEATTSDERQTSFKQMMEIALETADE